MNVFQQVRRPLVAAACSMIAGFFVYHLCEGAPLLFLGAGALSLAVVCWKFEHRNSFAGIYLSILLLAAAYGAIEKMPIPRRAVLPLAEVLYPQQEIVGRVDEALEFSGEDAGLSFLFRAEAVLCGYDWLPCDARVRIYLNNAEAPVSYGESWRIVGRYRGYNAARGGVAGAMSAEGSSAVRVRPADFSLKALCYRVRSRALRVFGSGMEAFPEQNQLLAALLLGYRKALSPSLYRMFAATGTLHIFAISGLHVGVLAAILIAALKLIGVPRPRWGLFLIPALFLYVVSTGMKSSAFRAFTMAAVYFSAPLFGRKPDSVSSIALAAILLLCLNPFQIGEPGFLLSFTVVSGIVMVHRYATHRRSELRSAGWAAPLTRLRGPQFLLVLYRAIGLLALTSVAAWVFSAPLTARFFNALSPVALVGNLIIIPLTFMIVLTGCLTLMSAPVSVWAGTVFNYANRVFVSLLITVIRFFDGLSGAYIFVRSPSSAVLALWYSGLVLFFSGPSSLRRLAAVLVFGALLLWGHSLYHPFSDVEVRRLGTTAVAVRISSRRWVLVTDGSRFFTSQTIRFLQKMGVNQLDSLVVSDRHAGIDGIEPLCVSFSPEKVYVNASSQEGLLDRLLEAGIPAQVSHHLRWPAGAGALQLSSGY